MEIIKDGDYQEDIANRSALLDELLQQASPETLKELGLDITAEQAQIETDQRRADLLQKLKTLTGRPMAVFPGEEMPGVAGYVKTNGEQTIYMADHVLDDPAFADHVAKHEAYHLKTLLVLPVEPDFTAEHLSTLDRYLSESFQNNLFYVEGFNEWLTSNNDEQNESVTAYTGNVKAAKTLESLAFSATGESLMNAFADGNSHAFARILKATTDKLMLYEALEAGDYDVDEKTSLMASVKSFDGLINSPEKAAVVIEAWSSRLKAEALKKKLEKDDYAGLIETIAAQKAAEKRSLVPA